MPTFLYERQMSKGHEGHQFSMNLHEWYVMKYALFFDLNNSTAYMVMFDRFSIQFKSINNHPIKYSIENCFACIWKLESKAKLTWQFKWFIDLDRPDNTGHVILRYYRFQITETHICHAYARASPQNHHIFSFLRNVRLSQVIRFISQHTLFFEQYRYHLQVTLWPLSDELFRHKFTLFLKSWHCSAHFSHCHYCFNSYYGSHVSITTLTTAFIDSK